MFRDMRRKKQQLTKEDCVQILKSEKRGALGVMGDEGYPYVLPINYYYDETNETIYFHGSKVGHKIESIKNNEKVCFTVWNSGERKDGDWAYYVKSVICFGTASLMTDPNMIYEKARAFGLKYYPSEKELDAEIKKDLKYVQMVAITIDHMTGKLVHEK